MSLIGIDVGTSAVKCVAYDDAGNLLTAAQHDLSPQYPKPGYWEQGAEDVWQATTECLQQVGKNDQLQRDPPIAMAISASGRENFLADASGTPLSPAIIGADIRGEEFEIPASGVSLPEEWTISCGHQRERMDPIFRLQWWQKYHPDLVDRAKYFFGWQDFLAFRLTGIAATDTSLASRYQIFDLASMTWSPERVKKTGIEPSFLPELLPWGSIIGEINSRLAKKLGLPQKVKLAVGCHDTQSAAIGVGVSKLGAAALSCGNFENLMITTSDLPTRSMITAGFSVMPHPGETGLSIMAVSPTGNAVFNWARKLLNMSINELEANLDTTDPAPSPVLAIPYLSGSMLYWENRRNLRGAFTNLTLATSPIDIIRAFMESIAYEHVLTLRLMREEQIEVNSIRATGGGSRSEWWIQLKADMLDIPIEVIDQPEPGAFGAALLAGLAVGIYDDLDSSSEEFIKVSRFHKPDAQRRELHIERLQEISSLIPVLINSTFGG